jgi:hypothetical protein
MKIGDIVTWKSQAGGSFKEKTGRIIAFVDAMERGFDELPTSIKPSRIKFQNVSVISDRVIVEVSRGGKSMQTDFYAPYVIVVKLVEGEAE